MNIKLHTLLTLSASCKGKQPASVLRAYNDEPASIPRGLKLQPMQKTRVSAAGFGVTKAERVNKNSTTSLESLYFTFVNIVFA